MDKTDADSMKEEIQFDVLYYCVGRYGTGNRLFGRPVVIFAFVDSASKECLLFGGPHWATKQNISRRHLGRTKERPIRVGPRVLKRIFDTHKINDFNGSTTRSWVDSWIAKRKATQDAKERKNGRNSN